jgi:hypothetical protein
MDQRDFLDYPWKRPNVFVRHEEKLASFPGMQGEVDNEKHEKARVFDIFLEVSEARMNLVKDE